MYDRDIRDSLRAEVELQHRADPGTKIVDELGLRQGQVRVDVAVVNGALKGYEIKSPADTLRRLPAQVEVYSQVLDFAALVLAERHRDDAWSLVPDWWEILLASEGPAGVWFETLRAGRPNPAVDKRALTELLWHSEALALLREKGVDRGLAGKPRAAAWDRISQACSLDEVRAAVRTRLKERVPRRPAR